MSEEFDEFEELEENEFSYSFWIEQHMIMQKKRDELLAENSELIRKSKILVEALELIRDDSDDWRSKMIALNALEEIIRIK